MKVKRVPKLIGFIALSVCLNVAQYFVLPMVHAQESTAKEVTVEQACNGTTTDQAATRPVKSWPPADFSLIYPPFINLPMVSLVIPLPDPLPSIRTSGATGTFPLGFLNWNIETFTDAVRTGQFGTNTSAQQPKVGISFGSNGSAENQRINVVAEPQNFISDNSTMQLQWFDVKEDGTLVSLNGVAAGGMPFKQYQKTESRCAMVIRDVKDDFDADKNNNGLGDIWESRYGFDSSDPNLPNEDPDRDGFDATGVFVQNQDTDNNLIKDPIINAPAARSATGGPKGVAGPIRTYGGSDAVFTNLDEYIWGTNPIDPDSDDDGYTDEQDVVGTGQTSINFVPDQYEGSSLTLEVDVLGESQLVDDKEEVVTKITGHQESLSIHPDEQIAAILTAEPELPRVDDIVKFTVDASSSRARAGHLQYDWSIDGKSLNEYTDSAFVCSGSGLGISGYDDVLRCRVGRDAFGSQHDFTVGIFDPQNGEHTQVTTTITIGDVVIGSHEPTIIPQRPIDVTGKTEIPPRFVKVVASLTIPADADPQSYLKNFDFYWYVDQVLVNDEHCSDHELDNFPPTTAQVDEFRKQLTFCGRGSNYLYFEANSSNEHDYVVDLVVNNNQTTSRYGLAEEIIRHDPAKNVVALPWETGSNIQPNNLIAGSAAVPAGGTITFKATDRPVDQKNRTYVWSVNGQEVSRGAFERTFTYRAGERPGTLNVQLQILDDQSKQIATDLRTIVIQDPRGPGLVEQGRTGFASISNLITQNYARWLMQYLIFGFIALAFWIGVKSSINKNKVD